MKPKQDQVHQTIDTYPKISIITPSYNQGNYIEETIQSIINQNYPNLEYMIFDGGSNDQSLEIIKKYEKWISFWESKSDKGQANAINKGIAKCEGDIVGWINSDDMLVPGSLYTIANNYLLHNDKILLGDVINYNEKVNKTKVIRQKNVNFQNMIIPFMSSISWHQPGIFVPTKLLNQDLLLDETLRYFFDQDWFIRLLQRADIYYLEEVLAIFRLHQNSKTVNEKFNWLSEQEIVVKRYWDVFPEKKKNKILSNLELISATYSLGDKKWDRKLGRKKLINSVKLYPSIILSKKFIEFVIRSILPYKILIWIRTTLIKLHLFSPYD